MLFSMGLGLGVGRRWPRAGRTVCVLGLLVLYALSTDIVATALIQPLERYPPVTSTQLVRMNAQAIVVMGGGRYPAAPEYGNTDAASPASLARVRFASHIAKVARLPILVTGGRVYGEAISEAQALAEVLSEDFGQPVRWLEERARNSAENARYSYALLRREGIRRIILVTHAYHMPRSVRMFEQAGFEVVPAGTGYTRSGNGHYGVLAFLPSMNAFSMSGRALHEYLGQAWYALRY